MIKVAAADAAMHAVEILGHSGAACLGNMTIQKPKSLLHKALKVQCPGEHIVSMAGHLLSLPPSRWNGVCAPCKSKCMDLQEAMDEDAAPLPLAPGRAKADSLAVLLGQALRAGDQALLEKCAPLEPWAVHVYH